MSTLISYLKTSDKNSVNKTLSDVSALYTMLKDVSIVNTTGTLVNSSTTVNSVSFMLNILKIFGVTEEEIIDFVCGKIGNSTKYYDKKSWIYIVETALKSIIFLNLKNLFTCSLNPLIPNKLMHSATIKGLPFQGGEGISINIDEVDLYDMLDKSPINKEDGASLYFDAYNSVYDESTGKTTTITKLGKRKEMLETQISELNNKLKELKTSIKKSYDVLMKFPMYISTEKNIKICDFFSIKAYEELILDEYFKYITCADESSINEIKNKLYNYLLTEDASNNGIEKILDEIFTKNANIKSFSKEELFDLVDFFKSFAKEDPKMPINNFYKINGFEKYYNEKEIWPYILTDEDYNFFREQVYNIKNDGAAPIEEFYYKVFDGGFPFSDSRKNNCIYYAILTLSKSLIQRTKEYTSTLGVSYNYDYYFSTENINSIKIATKTYIENSPIYFDKLKELEQVQVEYNKLNTSTNLTKTKTIHVEKQLPPHYTADELWKSLDFDAYLWYVIHRGASNPDERRLYWDNRNRRFNEINSDKNTDLRYKFFNDKDGEPNKKAKVKKGQEVYSGFTSPAQYFTKGDGSGEQFKRWEIIKCQFAETMSSGQTNILKVWINPYRYANRRTIKQKIGKKGLSIDLNFNATIFEFDWEYLDSLRILEPKTLVANIIHSILGLSITSNIGFSLQREIIKGKVKSVVENIINNDDTEYDDCYTSFSNAEYDNLIEKTRDAYNGVYRLKDGSTYTIDKTNVENLLNKIDEATTPEEQKTAISNVFTQYKVTDGTDEDDSYNANLTYGNSIIDKILEETVFQIVMQALTPKVAILFKINSAIQGEIEGIHKKSEDNKTNLGSSDFWDDFINNLGSALQQLIIEIKNLILQELYAYMMAIIMPILEKFTLELAKELIEDYKNMLEQAIRNCVPTWISSKNRSSVYAIDNVTYADIGEQTTVTNNDTCN